MVSRALGGIGLHLPQAAVTVLRWWRRIRSKATGDCRKGLHNLFELAVGKAIGPRKLGLYISPELSSHPSCTIPIGWTDEGGQTHCSVMWPHECVGHMERRVCGQKRIGIYGTIIMQFQVADRVCILKSEPYLFSKISSG